MLSIPAPFRDLVEFDGGGHDLAKLAERTRKFTVNRLFVNERTLTGW